VDLVVNPLPLDLDTIRVGQTRVVSTRRNTSFGQSFGVLLTLNARKAVDNTALTRKVLLYEFYHVLDRVALLLHNRILEVGTVEARQKPERNIKQNIIRSSARTEFKNDEKEGKTNHFGSFTFNW
jgi:hypothetical protein